MSGVVAELGHNPTAMPQADEIAIAIKNKLMVPVSYIARIDRSSRNDQPPLHAFVIVTVDRRRLLTCVESAVAGAPGWVKFKEANGRMQVKTGKVEFWIDPNRIPQD